MENNKGCVYFFRHIGLTPVKIGFSTNESPIHRFSQFKTYAPYGSEIVGFIMTDTPYDIERSLHEKYASCRLNGEWFEMSDEQVKREIDFYSSAEDVKDRNNFQIAWAVQLERRKRVKVDSMSFQDLLDGLQNLFTAADVKSLCFQLNISNRNAFRWLSKNNGVKFNRVSHGVYMKI